MLKTIYGNVVKIDLNTKVQKHNSSETYEAYRIVYTNDRGEVETFQKPVQGLKFKPKVKDVLNQLHAGEDFTLTLEKNSGGFLDVVDLVKGSAVVSDLPTATLKPAAPVGRVTGSNYETAQERADKQRYIVRQSSIANAIALASNNKEKIDIDGVIASARLLEAFVFAPTVDDLVSDTAEIE